MTLLERLSTLGFDRSGPLVQRLLGESAVVLTWRVSVVDWSALNPGTVGIFRVTGEAQAASGVHSFALFCKAVADSDEPWVPSTGYLHEPQDWNYWKRESLAFESGLLDAAPEVFEPVLCLGAEADGDQVWIWLEELHDAGGPSP